MNSSEIKNKILENYLSDLRDELAPLEKEDLNEVVLEIEGLILDAFEIRAEGEGLEEIISGLGDPKTLARQYVGHVIYGKPLPFLLRARRASKKGASGVLKGFISLFGFSIALALIATALVKPFYPETSGLWVGDGAFFLGISKDTSNYQELLGYWIIPLGLILGGGLFYLTLKTLKLLK